MDKAEKALDVLFLGDSAIESMRGTYVGSSWTAFASIARSFKELLPSYSVGALGIAGTTTLIAVFIFRCGVPLRSPLPCLGPHLLAKRRSRVFDAPVFSVLFCLASNVVSFKLHRPLFNTPPLYLCGHPAELPR